MYRKISILLVVFLLFFSSISFAADQNVKKEFIIQFVEEIPSDVLDQLGFETMYTYESIDSVAVKGTNEQLTLLRTQTSIISVTENKTVNATFQPQTVSWGYEPIHAPEMASNGLTGQGVKVAVLDTGIDIEHPDLVVTGGTCVAKSCPAGYDDDNGHGTHIAGIIAAQNNNLGVLGIAPNVELYAIKSLDANGDGTTATILAGLDWAIQNQIDIVNLSVTTKANDPALKSIVDKAYQQGIILVGSGGNSGTTDETANNVQYPAKYPSVIAVSSVNEQLQRAELSATGQEIEIAAPGEEILSTYPTDLTINGQASEGYAIMSGTSMATPFVVGMLALYKEKEPTLTNAELRTLLQTSAMDLGVVGKDNVFGYGLVQAAKDQTNTDGNEVFVSSVAGGKVQFEITQNANVESYTVTRGKTPVTSLSEGPFTDYVIAGQYQYSFRFKYFDGREVIVPVNVNVPEPKISDLNMRQWFATHMVYLHESKIVTGVTETTMQPNAMITRAQAVTMIGRALGLNGEKRETVFSDVNPGSFASGYIQSAYENEILKGFPDKTFRPDQPVTRVEMAILIAKAYNLQDTTPSEFPDVSQNVTGYEAIYKVANANIAEGYIDGTFKPYEPMKRSTFSVFIARAENPFFKNN